MKLFYTVYIISQHQFPIRRLLKLLHASYLQYIHVCRNAVATVMKELIAVRRN